MRNTDVIPAMLSPHEAVLNKDAADLVGRHRIAAFNAMGNAIAARKGRPSPRKGMANFKERFTKPGGLDRGTEDVVPEEHDQGEEMIADMLSKKHLTPDDLETIRKFREQMAQATRGAMMNEKPTFAFQGGTEDVPGYVNPLDLYHLPLSAYTPGQGNLKMEGGRETASGKPVYTYEMFIAGKAPYVTGATSNRNPSGATVTRYIGNTPVPVRITDYGSGVKGLDIASDNPLWAKRFPYQGQRDFTPPKLASERSDLSREAGDTFYGGGQAPPTPTPTPSPSRFTPPTSGYLAGGQPYVPGGRTMVPTTWTNYPGVGQVPNAIAVNAPTNYGAIAGGALQDIGAGLSRASSQQAQQAAMAMAQARANVPTSSPGLQQAAFDPWEYIRAIQGFGG